MHLVPNPRTPANGTSRRLFPTVCTPWKNQRPRAAVDDVATGKGRGTVTAIKIDVDESMVVARKRDASVTRLSTRTGATIEFFSRNWGSFEETKKSVNRAWSEVEGSQTKHDFRFI